MKPTAQAAPLPLRKEICTEHTSAPLLLLLLRRAARLVSFSFSSLSLLFFLFSFHHNFHPRDHAAFDVDVLNTNIVNTNPMYSCGM